MRTKLTTVEPIADLIGNAAASSSQTAEAYDHLRNDLLSCRLSPSQRLNISELAQTMAVSPGAVREALSRLTSDGLVVAEPQRGFRVAPISAADLADLTQTRIQIECQCLRRAIEVGTVTWEASLVAIHHRLARTPSTVPGDPARVDESWAHLHAEFHEALVAGCDSQWLLRLRRILFAHSERYRRLSAPLGRKPRRVDLEHAEIVTATLARNGDRAVRLLTEHLTATKSALMALQAISDTPTLVSALATKKWQPRIKKSKVKSKG